MGAVEQSLPLELSEARLDELLSLWARWTRSNEPVRALGYPDTACGCVGGGYSQTFEDMVESAETKAAEAVDGAIDSLPPAQSCSVYSMHLYAVFRFRGDVHDLYSEARRSLKAGLPERGVY